MNSDMVYSILRREDGKIVIIAKERVEVLHHVVGNTSLVADVQGSSSISMCHFP